jgi:CDP-diacylglycerol--glycerol-3-phosphate 3-phosphatidyltransferase
MLNILARGQLSRALDPVGVRLARAGLSPDVVTVAGTVGVVVSSIAFTARGHLLLGTIAVTLAALTDLIDGSIARARGRPSRWGAFLDSTMDRIADLAIFGCLAFWLLRVDRPAAGAAALLALITGAVVSYAKARAESLGLTCNVGIAERGERLLIAGAGALLESAGVPYGLDVGLWLLCALTLVTVWQRIHVVWRQTRTETVAGVPGPGPSGGDARRPADGTVDRPLDGPADSAFDGAAPRSADGSDETTRA